MTPSRVRSLAILLTVPWLLPAISRSAEPLPEGWRAVGAVSDPGLAPLTNEQLIDRLTTAEPALKNPGNRQLFWPIGGVAWIGKGVPFESPPAVELVRRGLPALPALLAHLTDPRPTRMVYVVHDFRPEGDWGTAYSDEYAPRDPSRPPIGVNTKARRKIDEEGTYTFKVGDLCYVAIGQIVGRDLVAVRSRGEDASFISGAYSANPGDRFHEINSPVATAALADAVRADWGSLSRDEHVKLLEEQVSAPLPRFSHVAPGLVRLLFYYPDKGAPIAERLLRRAIDDKAKGMETAGETVNSWNQRNFLRQLEPFRWAGMRAALLDSFRSSVRGTDEAVARLPPNTWDPGVPSLGSDLVVQEARLLARQGHDAELTAAIAHRAELIEASLRAPAGEHLDTARFVNAHQAQDCRKFLAELESAAPEHASAGPNDLVRPPARGNVRLGPATAKRENQSVVLNVPTIDPGLKDILLGRVIITEAKDDAGVVLWQEARTSLAPVSVGMSSTIDLERNRAPTLSARLTLPAPRAKSLRLVQGWLELVVPARDPNAVVKIEDVRSRLGSFIQDTALEKAGVRLTLHDQTSLRSNGSAISKRSSDSFLPTILRAPDPDLQPGDVALELNDPDGRFLNVEFRDREGHSLRYNHNGNYHASSGTNRVDVYRLGPEIPTGTEAVVWLRTDEAMLIAPLDLTNVPLQP